MTGTPSSAASWIGEAYPSIEDIVIEVVESCGGTYGGRTRSLYSRAVLSPHLPCCTRLACRGGGLHLRPLIDRMVAEHRTTAATAAFCGGQERSGPRRAYERCTNTLLIRATIRYRDEAPAVAPH